MAARAEAAAETGRRILGAVHALLAEEPFDRITMGAVAERAGVTVQTVIRRFESKEGLLAAAVEAGRSEILAQRGGAPPGDRAAAVENLFAHYERWGRVMLRLLEHEHRLPDVATLVGEGRAEHAAWVGRVFAVELARAAGPARSRLRTQLAAVSDVYVWKLLRLDLGVSRAEARSLVLGMIDALCAHGG